ncbi:hypothetical protein KFE80_12280 [bacterium SCSIO 12696]|nr:hypothetical protein KFE80_12280 [bacterium SCSIO 12696]
MEHKGSQVKFLTTLLCFLMLYGCSENELENASASYKSNHDYESLAKIHASLTEGMRKSDVEMLLGESDYSPIEGQYYYSSDRYSPIEGSGNPPTTANVGLIVEYRITEYPGDGTIKSILTDRLQGYYFGPIGE